VTDDGTVKFKLFDDRLTAAPPAPAVCVSVTVHVELAGAVRVVGLQESAFSATGTATVIDAPVPLAAIDVPLPDEATTPVIWTEIDGAGVGVVWKVTLAATPSDIPS
jgi:hypothetical protein